MAIFSISASAPNICDLSPQVVTVRAKLNDRSFIQKQINCMLSNRIEDCDDTGRKAKNLGPQILSNRCPARVCDKCTKHAINMVIQRMQSKYPTQWHQIMQKMGPAYG